MINERTIKTLEYEKIMQKVAHYAASKPAKDRILLMRPYDEIEKIELELEKTCEADKILFEHAVNPVLNFDDISDALDSAEVLSMLTMQDLLKICRLLKVASSLQSQILNVPDDEVIKLKTLARTIYTNKKLADDIDRSILSDTEMSDNASSLLRDIRVKIKRTGENIKQKLNSYITSSAYAKYIQDNIVTVRGDRYVIPLKAEYKGMIPGLIHDQSSSGATLYVEPFAIVELNNDLKGLLIEEEAEIERILRDFTYRISEETGLLRYSLNAIIEFDVIFAKAYYGNSIKGVKPVFSKRDYIEIRKGRHPLIAADKVVPNDIMVGKDFNMLLITGPNTGGKTVCLKLIGLIELIGMSGIFVPALYAELACADNIFCDIGDEQSIEQNLSTFSSHMTNVVNILGEMTEKSLVLLDELGAGTDPTEGAALALGIADYIMKTGAKAVITTHYNEFKEYAVITDRVQNASMDFDPKTYSPTYKLIIGTPGASNALAIAEKLGLKKEILEQAKKGIGSKKFDFENVLKSLENARREAEINKEESEKNLEEAKRIKSEAEKEREKLYAQRERLNASVKRETKKLVDEAMAEANEIIDRMRALLDNPTDGDIFLAQKLRKSLKKFIIAEDNEFQGFGEEIGGEIVVGDRVLVKNLNAEGEVLSVNPIKADAKVKLGKMTCNAKLSDLVRLKSSEKKETVKAESRRVLFNEQVSQEINLIGKTSLEAEKALEEYLDKASRVGLHEVRIIHGYGEGILRKTVQNYLKTRKEIESFRPGEYGEGGRGVTVAYFK